MSAIKQIEIMKMNLTGNKFQIFIPRIKGIMSPLAIMYTIIGKNITILVM